MGMMNATALTTRRDARRAEIARRMLPVFDALRGEVSSYLELPVERFLAETGTSRATFYRHFDDKNDLLLELGRLALADAAHASMETWRLPLDATRSELQAAIVRSAAAYRPHIGLIGSMVEVSGYDASVKEAVHAAFEGFRATVAAYLAEGRQRGLVRADLHLEETAGWLTWMAERGLQQLVVVADEEGVARFFESLADIIWYTAFEGQGKVDDLTR